MDFLDIIDVFVNLSRLGDIKTEAKKPKIFILFSVLLIGGIFWFVVELNSIFDLLSPVKFLGLFIMAGLILTIGTIILIYKLDLIEELRRKDFFLILIPVTLMTVSLASFVNRTYEINKQESLVTISDPLQGATISRVLVKLDGKEVRIRIPKSIGVSLQDGDSILVQKKKGLMGFEIIGNISNVH